MFLPIMTFHNHRGEQIIRGIPQELIDRLSSMEGTTGHQLCPVHCSVTVIDGEELKYAAQEMCLEAGVQLLLHSLVTEVVVEDGVLKEVVVQNKSGRQPIRAKTFIDATGDGDVAARSQVPCNIGRPADGGCQPPTLMFRLGDVDIERFVADTEERRRSGSEDARRYDRRLDYGYDEYRQGKRFIFFGYNDVILRARSRGEFPVPQDGLIVVTLPRLGEVAVNMVKVPGTDATDAQSLTQAEIEGRRQIFIVHSFLKKYIPGFAQSYLSASAHQIGIRESRRIQGEYTLTVDDLAQNREFSDSIARGGYMVDVHHPAGRGGVKAVHFDAGYRIPYRSLIPLGVENLIVAGRCISTDCEAFGAIRVMATCMAIGQAAGTAAAVCIRTGATPRTVDIREVQSALVRDKAVI